MEFGNPNSANIWVSDDGSKVHCKKISIGIWNMDADESVLIPHGLGANYLNIINCFVAILNDVSSVIYPLYYFQDVADPSLLNGGIQSIGAGGITLMRRVGGSFDNANFDDGAMNRGYIHVMYTTN